MGLHRPGRRRMRQKAKEVERNRAPGAAIGDGIIWQTTLVNSRWHGLNVESVKYSGLSYRRASEGRVRWLIKSDKEISKLSETDRRKQLVVHNGGGTTGLLPYVSMSKDLPFADDRVVTTPRHPGNLVPTPPPNHPPFLKTGLFLPRWLVLRISPSGGTCHTFAVPPTQLCFVSPFSQPIFSSFARTVHAFHRVIMYCHERLVRLIKLKYLLWPCADSDHRSLQRNVTYTSLTHTRCNPSMYATC